MLKKTNGNSVCTPICLSHSWTVSKRPETNCLTPIVTILTFLQLKCDTMLFSTCANTDNQNSMWILLITDLICEFQLNNVRFNRLHKKKRSSSSSVVRRHTDGWRDYTVGWLSVGEADCALVNNHRLVLTAIRCISSSVIQ